MSLELRAVFRITPAASGKAKYPAPENTTSRLSDAEAKLEARERRCVSVDQVSRWLPIQNPEPTGIHRRDKLHTRWKFDLRGYARDRHRARFERLAQHLEGAAVELVLGNPSIGQELSSKRL